jgi:hypothetical protein
VGRARLSPREVISTNRRRQGSCLAPGGYAPVLLGWWNSMQGGVGGSVARPKSHGALEESIT